ncbi:MAG: glycogen/starch synthase [Bacteroidales bacterium]|jgi:starch synthase|nr:glycogen/starch synthase [Bacteroidales bacterium]
MKLKVLYIAQEIIPYMPDTKMSNMCRFLPQGIQDKKKEIRTFLPKFGNINERRNQLHEVIRLSGMNIVINNVDYPLLIKVASVQTARMQFYFIDNDILFNRKYQFADEEKEFADNDDRAIFFTYGVIETIKKLNWKPDIIHCHGWFTGLIPFYLKKIYNEEPLFADKPKIIYSVYDDQFKVALNKNLKQKIASNKTKEGDFSLIKEPTWENLTKFAIQNSNATVFTEDHLAEQFKEFAKQEKKPYLHHVDMESYVDKYNEFYDKVNENQYL